MRHSTLIRRSPELLHTDAHTDAHAAASRPDAAHRVRLVRDEAGATTAEYATVTGAAVGFGALLWKFLTSDLGQKLIEFVFNWIMSLIPG